MRIIPTRMEAGWLKITLAWIEFGMMRIIFIDMEAGWIKIIYAKTQELTGVIA